MLQARQCGSRPTSTPSARELARIQDACARSASGSSRLRARLAEARTVLAERLVEIYKADEPDVVTVILESDGFADLLERDGVHAARLRTGHAHHRPRPRRQGGRRSRPPKRLDGLEERQQRSHRRGRRRGATRSRRSRAGSSTAARRSSGARARKRSALATTRDHRHALEGDLRALEKRAGAGRGRAPGRAGRRRRPGPIRAGLRRPDLAGQRPDRVAFGMRWGRLHAGVDIAVPTGTPIRAADSGTRRADGLGRRLRQLHLHRSTAAGCRPATRTSRASAPRWARASARAR